MNEIGSRVYTLHCIVTLAIGRTHHADCGTRAIDNTGCRVAMVASMEMDAGAVGGGGEMIAAFVVAMVAQRRSHVTSHLITFKPARTIDHT